MEETPHFFAFLSQSHFLLATAPLRGTELAIPDASFILGVRSRFPVLPVAKGSWRWEVLRLYVPSSQLGLGCPSFLSPWTLGAWNGHFSWGLAFSCGLPLKWAWALFLWDRPLSSNPSWVSPSLVSGKRFSKSQVLFPDLAFLIQIDFDGLKLGARIISTKDNKFPFSWG